MNTEDKQKNIENKLLEMEGQIKRLTDKLEASPENESESKATIVVFSGELDKALSAFIIATGAASMNTEVNLYFTFWGLNLLKKTRIYKGKNLLSKACTMMMPVGLEKPCLSNMHCFGMGAAMIKKLMHNSHVASLPEMLSLAKELNINLIACRMTMDIMGIKEDELIDGLQYGGAGMYLEKALKSKLSLFI